MKIKSFATAACLAAGTLLTTSCIGSFGIFNSIVKWEGRATNSKIVNEIIYVVLTPVNLVCGAADFTILNTIEFWTGSNPLVSSIGKTQQVTGQDGRIYAVKTLKNGYEITSPDGEVSKYIHNSKDDSWSLVQNGKTTPLIRYNGDGTIETFVNGQAFRVTADEAGLMQVRLAADGSCYAMR